MPFCEQSTNILNLVIIFVFLVFKLNIKPIDTLNAFELTRELLGLTINELKFDGGADLSDYKVSDLGDV